MVSTTKEYAQLALYLFCGCCRSNDFCKKRKKFSATTYLRYTSFKYPFILALSARASQLPFSKILDAGDLTQVTAAAGPATNPILLNLPENPSNESDLLERPTKRRRIVPVKDRKRALVRKCRRCKRGECSGNSDILTCNMPCTVPCKKCGQLQGCRGVDGGRRCTVTA